MALAVYLKDNIFIIIQIKIFSNIYWNFLDALFKLISNYLGFPGNSAGKESACNSGDPSSIPGSGRSLGEGKGYPLQYSGLENSTDCIVHGVSKSWARLSNFHFHYHVLSQSWRRPEFLFLLQRRKDKHGRSCQRHIMRTW